MSELGPLVDYLKQHFPWLSNAWLILSGVMAFSRLVLKPFSQRMRERATAKLVESAEEGTEQERQEILDRLHSPYYRAAVFWLDTVFSFKLPTHIEFHRLVALAEQKRNASKPAE